MNEANRTGGRAANQIVLGSTGRRRAVERGPRAPRSCVSRGRSLVLQASPCLRNRTPGSKGLPADRRCWSRALSGATTRGGSVAIHAYYMFDERRPVVPGEVLAIGAADVAGFRASYRMLSFMLARQGFAVDHEPPRQDRPERVKAICREVYGWSGLVP
jgi:hypothetical protein